MTDAAHNQHSEARPPERSRLHHNNRAQPVSSPPVQKCCAEMMSVSVAGSPKNRCRSTVAERMGGNASGTALYRVPSRSVWAQPGRPNGGLAGLREPHWKCPIVPCPSKVTLSHATSPMSIKKGSSPVRVHHSFMETSHVVLSERSTLRIVITENEPEGARTEGSGEGEMKYRRATSSISRAASTFSGFGIPKATVRGSLGVVVRASPIRRNFQTFHANHLLRSSCRRKLGSAKLPAVIP